MVTSACNWVLIHYTRTVGRILAVFVSVKTSILMCRKGVSCFQRGLELIRFQLMPYLFKWLFRVVFVEIVGLSL